MAKDNMDLLAWLRKQLVEAEPDLLREMVSRDDRARGTQAQERQLLPDWLLERRRQAERAMVAVVAECYVKASAHAAPTAS